MYFADDGNIFILLCYFPFIVLAVSKTERNNDESAFSNLNKIKKIDERQMTDNYGTQIDYLLSIMNYEFKMYESVQHLVNRIILNADPIGCVYRFSLCYE